MQLAICILVHADVWYPRTAGAPRRVGV